MQEKQKADWAPAADPPKPGADKAFGRYVDTGRQGLIRRLLATLRHGYGLLIGGLAAHLRDLPERERRSTGVALQRLMLWFLGIPLSRKLKRESFPVQLRIRLERLGPTYIKLGQILSMREDLLPPSVTGELRNLLNRLPAVPYPEFLKLVAEHLGKPVEEVFAHIRTAPLGSASIGQTHLATLHDGTQVILKVVKPGIRETLKRDTLLLGALGGVLQLLFPRYQPGRILDEFCEYTRKEVDLSREADNAETFASAFKEEADIRFPRIYREHSNRDLLCMEYLEGIEPTSERALALRESDREKLVDLGAGAIISMLYRDGFFHADLHPGNLLILPGPQCGFIDLGMVGRFDTELKHTLLYYFYSLASGDAESAATYLAATAKTSAASDPAGFRRDVEDICRHWTHRARFNDYSLARLVMQSVAKGAEHRMYFPMEMVLMVKAIVTFEAVGNELLPGFDIGSVSRRHVHRILIQRFGPLRLARESLTGMPELIDALAKTPKLLTEGLKLVEQATSQPAENPFAGIRATLFGGFCLVAGAILAGSGGPWPLWAALLIIGALLPLRRGR